MAFGIICEYNPFHNGHLHQINEIKKISDEPIVCVMSGHITQRGEIAIADKYARAEMALSSGADIVLELPVPFCFSSAEYFAAAGVHILNAVGVDKICFGSECADREKIVRIAAAACSPEFKEACEALSGDEGNASAYFELLAKISGETDILSNDILGVEYTKAIIKNGYSMQIYPIKREGSAYREKKLEQGSFPSASAVRECMLKDSFDKIKDFLPPASFDILKISEISSFDYIKEGALLAIRLMEKDKGEVAVSDAGLINRIFSTARKSSCFDEFERELQTKKYTSSAIRRAVLYILLGIKMSDICAKPRYTALLGANKKGREYLSSIRKKETDTVVLTKPADAANIVGADRQYQLNIRADALYTFCFKNRKETGFYIKKNPVIK